VTRARLEVLAVALTGALHLVFEERFHAKLAFLALAATVWTGYLVRRRRADPGVLAAWGLRREGLRGSARACGAVLAAGALALAAFAGAHGRLRLHLNLLPLFLLYPAWGLVQHFLLQALFVRNLRLAGLRPVACTALAAPLFGLAHWPDRVLMAATVLLALALTPVYLRWRNLWPLAVVHGWLGALAYFWLLGRDPWAEMWA